MAAYSPTYSTLLTEIQDICENTNAEFVANIPKFLQRAQDQVQRDLALEFWRGFELDTIGSAALARGATWLVVRSLYLPTQNKWIERRTLDYVRGYGGSTGRPRVWAEDSETSILLAPAPEQNYSVRIESYRRLAPLVVTSNETNWITDNAGDLLLGMLLIHVKAPHRLN